MFYPENMQYKGKIIDITVPISPSTPIFPGDPKPSIERTCTLEKDGCTVSRLSFGSHTGTHVDAPSHILKDGHTVDRLDIGTLMGRAVVLDFSQKSGALTEPVLDKAYYGSRTNGPKSNHPKNNDLNIPESTPILLLKTKASSEKTEISGSQEGESTREMEIEGPVYLDAGAAAWIFQQGFETVGIDNFSVDSLTSENLPAHHILLSNNVNVVECLDLSSVKEGIYFFLCMPMKIENCDGAPARALLISYS